MKTAEGNARRRGRGKKNAEEGRRAGRGRAPGAWSPRVCRPRLRRSRPGNCCDGGRRVSARRRERARTTGDGRVASERKRRNRGGARGAPPRVVPRSPPPRPRACARGRARGRGWRARPPSPRRRSSRRRPGGPSRGSRDGDMAPKATTTTRGGSGTRPGVARAKARVVSDVTSASVESGVIGAALAVARCFDYTTRRGETTAVRP